MFFACAGLSEGVVSAQVFVYDTFTGTAGTALTSHTPNTGGTWAPNSSSATINLQGGNEAELVGATNPAVYVNSATPSSANYAVEVTGYWPASANNANYAVGVLARANSDNLPSAGDPSRYQAYLDGSGAVTLQYHPSGGSSATIATGSIGAQPSTAFSHLVALVANGSTISVYIDGVSVASGTDTNLTSAGYAGIRMYSPSGVSTLMAGSFLAASNLQLAITSVNGGVNPAVGAAFSVTVQAQVNGTAFNVLNATAVSLSANTGSLSGTLTGTIAAGSNSVTISGVTYTGLAQSVTLTATRTSGDPLAPGTNSFTAQVGAAAQLAFTTLPSTTGTSGTAWAAQPVVTVQDVGGNTVASYGTGVTLAIATGTGTLTCAANPVTPALGVATFAGCKLDKATTYTLKAASGTITNSTTNPSIAISAGTATQLAFTTQPGGGTGGTAWSTQPQVTVQDAAGNTVTGSSLSVTLAITSGTGTSGAALTCTTNPQAASSGVDTFAGCKINLAGSGYTLTATGSGVASGVSNAFNIAVGAATKLAYTTAPSAGTAGTAFSVTVQSQDAGGNGASPTSTTTITLSKATGGGTLSGTLTGTISTSANSVTISTPVYSKSDTMTLTATATAGETALTAVTSANIVFSAGASAKLAFTTQPGGGTGGLAWSTQPVVTVQDANGNTVTTDTSSVSLAITTNPGSGTLACTTNPLAATAGVATFAGCNINKSGTGYVITATDGTLTSIASSAFNITVGAAAQLAFTTQPGGGTGGTAWSQQPQVTVQDAGGNTVTGSSLSVTLAITSGTGTSGAALACTTNPQGASSGVDTFAGCKINLAGTNYTLTATGSGVTSGVSGAFNITVGAASQLVFTTAPSTTGTSGAAWATQPIVTVEDAGGNAVASYATGVTLAINTGTGTLTCTTNPATPSSGLAAFAGCSLDKATTYTLKATSGSLTSTTNPSIAISAGASAKLAFTTQPGGATGGTAWSQQPVVTVQDANGNTVTGDTSTVTLTITTNPGPGTLVCTSNPLAATAGVATFAGCRINKAGTGYVLTATDGSLTSAAGSSFNITVGSAANLLFTTAPSSTGTSGTAWATQPLVAAVDAGGNTVTSYSTGVTLAINSGTGTLSCTTNPVTPSSGVATFAVCKLDKAGDYTLKATSGSLNSIIDPPITISAGAATQLAFTTAPVSVATSTCSPQITVQTQDPAGNPSDPSSAATANLTATAGTFYSNSGCTTAITSVAIATTGNSASFYWKSTTATGSQTITATVSTPPFNSAPTQQEAVGTGNSATQQYYISLSSNPASPVAGQSVTFTATFTADCSTSSRCGSAQVTLPANYSTIAYSSVTGSSGSGWTGGASGQNVTVTSTTGGSSSSTTITAGFTAVAASTGTNLAWSSGVYSSTTYGSGTAFTLEGLNPYTTITTGPATKLVFTTQPGGGPGNAAWSQQPVVTVEDANGYTVTNSTAPVALAITGSPAGDTLTCAYNTLGASSGVAAFTYCSINNAGTYTLTATSSGLTSATSSNVTITTPTAVTFESLTASALDGGVLLQWRTGREVTNLGFHIYRDGVRVTSSPVAGSALLAGKAVLTAGNSYSWFDPNGSASSSYTLEDIDLDGSRTLHGPALFGSRAVSPAASTMASVMATRARGNSLLLNQLGRGGSASAVSFGGVGAPMPAKSRPGTIHQNDLAAGPAVKLGVTSEGWYHVDAGQLTAAGMPANVAPNSLRLFAEGQEQAITVLGSGPVSAIEFYGTGLNSTFSGTRVYWLTWGSNPGMRVMSPVAKAYGSAPAGFLATVQWQPRTLYFAALLNGDADNFFGPTLDATDSVTQALPVTHLATGTGSASLMVTMQGVTLGAHAVAVSLNGSQLGILSFNGQANSSSTFAVPDGVLQEGSATLALATYGADDVTVVDTVALTYPHAYTADGDYLRFSAPSGAPVTLGGFSNGQIQVADITDPTSVVLLPGSIAAQGAGYAVSFVPVGAGNRTLLAFTQAQESQPASITAHSPSSWSAPQAGADMVILSHANFTGSLGPLAALRKSQGHTVAVVDVAQVYDEFNYGEQSPYAIKDFLSNAQAVWTNQPHWVLLVGDATYDPHDYLQTGQVDYLPVELIGTALLETASDDWFADFNNDGNPQMAIGRLPVDSAAAATSLVNKIVAYEQAGATPWKKNALLVAGADDSGDAFSSLATAVQNLLPLNVTKVLAGSDASAAADVLSAIDAGVGLVNYIGHGSTEVWENLIDTTAASGVTNGAATPFVISMTCLNGYFQDVYTTALAKAFLGAPGGGAAAVWASSGLTDSGTQSLMNQAMVNALYGAAAATAGDAALAAKQAVTDLDVRRTWILFGDPAMKIQ